MSVVKQHFLNQVVDITQDPAVLVFRQVFKQLCPRVVVHVETLSPRVGRYINFVDDLCGQVRLGLLINEALCLELAIGKLALY